MDLKIKWCEDNYLEFINYLKSLGEEEYKKFNSKIIHTKYEMLGIRLPILRKITSEIYKGDYKSFLNMAHSFYYEEVMIKGFIIAKIKDINEFMIYFYDYLDFIDNWAINDSFCNSLKIVNKNKKYFLTVIDKLIKSNKEYDVRVGLILLLNFYIEEEYLDIIFSYMDRIKSEKYYINMAEAWLICEVFTKYPERTLIYLKNNHLNSFTINKAISKIRDSYRVSKEMKDYVLKYKVQ